MLEEKKTSKKEGRTTTTTQVSRNLDLVITNYAAKHGISKHEAADRIFQILYPDGAIPSTAPPIAPLGQEGEEPPQEISLVAPPEVPPGGVSGVLHRTVEDLATIKTIKALSEDLKEPSAKKEATELPSWQEIMNQRKMELLFGDSNPKGPQQDFATLLEKQRNELTSHFEKLLAEQRADTQKEQADFYKKKLEEKEAAEQRAEEIASIVAPIQDAVAQLDIKLEAVAKEMKPESKEPPTSAELEAIKDLGTNIREAITELKTKGAGGSKTEELGAYLDNLGTIIDKINELGKKGTGGTGEFDWRSVAIDTFGEVTTEAIKAFRETEGAKSHEEKPEAPSETPQLSAQIIERRVYNYALKKIAAGELSLDPYKAGEELGLTPNQVWQAVQSLQKRGALRSPQVSQTEQTEKPQEKTSSQAAEGLVEG